MPKFGPHVWHVGFLSRTSAEFLILKKHQIELSIHHVLVLSRMPCQELLFIVNIFGPSMCHTRHSKHPTRCKVWASGARLQAPRYLSVLFASIRTKYIAIADQGFPCGIPLAPSRGVGWTSPAKVTHRKCSCHWFRSLRIRGGTSKNCITRRLDSHSQLSNAVAKSKAPTQGKSFFGNYRWYERRSDITSGPSQPPAWWEERAEERNSLQCSTGIWPQSL